MKLGKAFCWRPFHELYIDRHGVKPCCHFNGHTSDDHAEVRNAIINNQWHPGCDHCQSWEQKGWHNSHRKVYVGTKDSAAVIENKMMPKFIRIELDNICNVACVTCDGSSSSRWIAEDRKISGSSIHRNHATDLRKYMIKDLWTGVDRLTVHGGEPFYSKNAKTLLEWLVANEISKRLTITLITNGTVIDHSMLVLIKQFRSNILQFSVDGIGKIFNLVRWPSKYDKVKENYHRTKQFLETEPTIIYTFSLLNACSTVSAMDILTSEFTQDIILNPVVFPDHYSAKHLPDDIKQRLIESYRDDPHGQCQSLIPILESPGDPIQFEKAKLLLAKLDESRQTDHRILFC